MYYQGDGWFWVKLYPGYHRVGPLQGKDTPPVIKNTSQLIGLKNGYCIQKYTH